VTAVAATATWPSRILTWIASMNTTGHPDSGGRLHQSVIFPTTLSVIRDMVSFDTVAPYTSAKCAVTSPVVNLFAVKAGQKVRGHPRRRAQTGE
jgi:hypothetical protein